MKSVLEQGDVVLVPFPFTDMSAVKTRPAVVVSNGSLKGDDVILCAMTSQKSGVAEVRIGNEDLSAGALPVVSYVRYGKVVCMDRKLAARIVARIGDGKLKEIVDGLIGVVGM